MAKAKPPGNWYPIHPGIATLLDDFDKRTIVPPDTELKTVLAIDPGTTNLAAAIIRLNGMEIHAVTTKFESPKFHRTMSKIVYIQRALEEWVMDTIDDGNVKIDLMVKESISHGSAGGVADAGRVQHCLEYFAANNHIPWIDVTPMSMRAHFKSKAKSDTKLAVYKRYELEFPSEDECDVFAIGMTGIAMHLGQYQTAKQKKAAK